MDFLYDNVGKGRTIALKPGVAFCLRAFYGLLRDLIQGAWVRFVQKINAVRFGNVTDLGTFLFGQERNVLDSYRGPLMEIQGGDCFYCQRALAKQIEVDHFIPWSRYPTDLGHNFVLAHPQCNNCKSDYLPAEEHLAAWFNHARLRVADMALARQFLECVLDGSPRPVRTVAVDPQLGGQFIGGLESDAPNVVGQLVGILLDLGDGLLPVGAVDSHGPARTDTMLGQEEHDLADFLLLLPTLPDSLQPCWADPLDVQQEIGPVLQDLQRPLLVDADDLRRQLLADAADRPRGEVLLNARCRRRMGGLQFVGLELLTVFPVHNPLAGRFQMLACGNGSGVPHDRHEVLAALDLHPQHGKAVLRVVVGHPFDQSFDGFGHGGNPGSFPYFTASCRCWQAGGLFRLAPGTVRLTAAERAT